MSIILRKLNLDDLTKARELFLNYPYKKYQQHVQKLDNEKVADLLTFLLEKQILNNKCDITGVFDDDELQGISGIDDSDFHTKNYGINFGKITDFLSYKNPEKYSPQLLTDLLNKASQKNYELISCRFDSDDFKNIHLLENAGFYTVGNSVKMSLELSKFQSDISDERNPHYTLEYYKPQYKDEILSIASQSHQVSHFHSDYNLNIDDTNKLFKSWTEKFCTDGTTNLYVALVGNEVIGFALFLDSSLFEKYFSRKIKILDFIALRNDIKGKGIGSSILRQIFAEMKPIYDLIELRTMQTNYPALNLYSKLGFKICSSDIIVHKMLKSA